MKKLFILMLVCVSCNTMKYDNYTNEVRCDDFIPYEFKMKEVLISLGNNFNTDFGRIEEKKLKLSETYELLDNSGILKATAKKELFSLGTKITITDENDIIIGSINEEILKSIFKIRTVYKILDKNGNMIAESKKIDIFTNFTIYKDDKIVCEIKKDLINVLSDTWNFKIYGNIDKRLLIFIPCFKTKSDNNKK